MTECTSSQLDRYQQFYGGPNETPEERALLQACKELTSSSAKLLRPTDLIRTTIQKLFRNRMIDLVALPCPTIVSENHPSHLVMPLIDSNSAFFEAIMDADEKVSNELWYATCEQLQNSNQLLEDPDRSTLMNCLSFYVNKLLPSDVVQPDTSITRMPSASYTHRVRTPLDLFNPSSPLLHRVKFDASNSFFTSSSLHPRHLTIFCNFVSILCSKEQFPSSNRLMVLRFVLKQFHMFCLTETNDSDMDHVKRTIMANPPFSAKLFEFLQYFLAQCPSLFMFKLLVQLWMTFCRPWRYLELPSGTTEEQAAYRYMDFVQSHEMFYRVLFGKILRRLNDFELTIDSYPMVMVIIQSCWKIPIGDVFKKLGIDPIPPTREVLDKLACLCKQHEALIETHTAQKTTLWESICGNESPTVRHSRDVVSKLKPILREADVHLDTGYLQAPDTPPRHTEADLMTRQTPVYCETPKRIPDLPDHRKDPVTGLMYLTELGIKQVMTGQRRFDFSPCSKMQPRSVLPPQPYEWAPLVHLLQRLSEYLNKLTAVKNLAAHYNDTTVTGQVARLIMDAPSPNPRGNSAPVYSQTIPVIPATLRLRLFANYVFLAAVFIFILNLKYGLWAFIPSVIVALFVLFIALTMDTGKCD